MDDADNAQERLSAIESALLALDAADYCLLKAGLTDDAHALQRVRTNAADAAEKLAASIGKTNAQDVSETLEEIRSSGFAL